MSLHWDHESYIRLVQDGFRFNTEPEKHHPPGEVVFQPFYMSQGSARFLGTPIHCTPEQYGTGVIHPPGNQFAECYTPITASDPLFLFHGKYHGPSDIECLELYPDDQAECHPSLEIATSPLAWGLGSTWYSPVVKSDTVPVSHPSASFSSASTLGVPSGEYADILHCVCGDEPQSCTAMAEGLEAYDDRDCEAEDQNPREEAGRILIETALSSFGLIDPAFFHTTPSPHNHQALLNTPPSRTDQEGRLPSTLNGVFGGFDGSFVVRPSPLPLLADSQTPMTDALQQDQEVWEFLQTNKKKKGTYKCTHCSGSFLTLLEFAHHIDLNGVQRPHKCPSRTCPWKIIGFTREPELRRHCTSQHAIVWDSVKNQSTLELPALSNDQRRYGCTVSHCNSRFKRRDLLQRHLRLVHSNPLSRFNTRMTKKGHGVLEKDAETPSQS